MKHIIEILEIKHLSKNGTVLWEAYNLPNTLHISGEQFILLATFVGGITNTYIPASYYFGLDNRTSLDTADTLLTAAATEPATYGYNRAVVGSSGQFIVSVAMTGHNIATSPIVTFSAIGGPWGPVKNMFLSTTANNTGYLIASVPLLSSITLNAGEQVSARIGLGLKDCP
ncbi:MAG: hypothetical protein M0R80_08565 [Proteobacteria bacterium]|jgi:hypothetical protein|nr:hypothetical protein [Pseudomonadota bacterium]